MLRSPIPLALSLVLAGCARTGGVSDSPTMPVVCIENAAVAVGSINAASSSTRWHVLPGQTECRTVRSGSPEIVIRAESIGGGAAGPARYQTRIPGGRGCWHWRLTDVRGPGSLLPCAEETGGTRRAGSPGPFRPRALRATSCFLTSPPVSA